MRSLPTIGAAASLTLCIVLGAASAGAAYTVDQSHSPIIVTVWSIGGNAPMGQEFTPSATLMNVAEFWVERIGAGSDEPADVFVRVREGAIDGVVLGQSGSVHFDGPHDGAVEFLFASPVALDAGSTYVLEIGIAPGGGNTFVGGSNTPDYAGGRGILGGTLRSLDLWFRTGATEGLPGAERDWGGVKAAYR